MLSDEEHIQCVKHQAARAEPKLHQLESDHCLVIPKDPSLPCYDANLEEGAIDAEDELWHHLIDTEGEEDAPDFAAFSLADCSTLLRKLPPIETRFYKEFDVYEYDLGYIALPQAREEVTRDEIPANDDVSLCKGCGESLEKCKLDGNY